MTDGPMTLITTAPSFRQPLRSLATVCGKRASKEEPKRYTKQTLPEKTCLVCQRPMQWRKAWAKVRLRLAHSAFLALCRPTTWHETPLDHWLQNWEEVKYCSERCRRRRSEVQPEAEQP